MLPIENKCRGRIGIIYDDNRCARIWKRLYPQETLFDLWEVRRIFADNFRRENCFVVHYSGEKEARHHKENSIVTGIHDMDDGIDGLLPLSWIQESGCFGFFPGETWKGRTWIEQNKIIAPDREVMAQLLHGIPGPAELRYLCPPDKSVDSTAKAAGRDQGNANAMAAVPSPFPWKFETDEIGYLFHPQTHGRNGSQYAGYLSAFAGKSRKKILREIGAIEKKGICFRYNVLEDVEMLFQLNHDCFGENGYFHDVRFLNAFRELAQMLHRKNMLRVVTVLVNNEVAAVDMAAVWNHTCTFLAGGTSRAFPGIAKLINLHHIQWACSHAERMGGMALEEIHALDFLCGDFGWKERFHLSSRPLFKITATGGPEFTSRFCPRQSINIPEKGCGYASSF